MSTSDLYRLYRTKATHFAEFRNGWGSAPILWGHLCVTYLGREFHGWGGLTGNDQKPLWDLVHNKKVPECVRIAHAFTMDYSYCPVARIKDAADMFSHVGQIVVHENYVNHWPAFAESLRVHKAKSRQLGVALSCTSVSDPWCQWTPEKKPWDIFEVLQR
jgi:hypothetical protein